MTEKFDSSMEFAVKYWAQLTLLLSVIGAIIKISLDYRRKKIETKNSLFFQEKIKHIIAFYDSYYKLKPVMQDYMDRSKFVYLNAGEVDKIIYPLVSDFYAKHNQLSLFLNDKEMESFNAINNSFKQIYGLSLKFNFRVRNNEDSIVVGNNFTAETEILFDTIQKHFKNIGQMIRKDFL
jgi:hypothetical protein